jgi:hypothetical protein
VTLSKDEAQNGCAADVPLLKRTPLWWFLLQNSGPPLLCKMKLRVSRILGVPTELAACFT